MQKKHACMAGENNKQKTKKNKTTSNRKGVKGLNKKKGMNT